MNSITTVLNGAAEAVQHPVHFYRIHGKDVTTRVNETGTEAAMGSLFVGARFVSTDCPCGRYFMVGRFLGFDLYGHTWTLVY